MTLLQDFRLRTPPRIGFRILLLKAAFDLVHVCLSLGRRHALLQASIDSYGSIFARQLLWGEEIGHPEFQFRPHFNSSRSGLKTGLPVWCVVPWQSAFSQRG
jgi:hypothetical protein